MCSRYSLLYYPRGSGEVFLRIAGIVRDSVVDGEGIRDVIFLQGCCHKCKGCHNPQTWDLNGGEHRYSYDVLVELINSTNDITISGGEPLLQFESLLNFLELVKLCTDKRVWMYTGCTVDPTKDTWVILSKYVDVVIDGKYVEELRDTNLRFRGSSNQRIIDLPKSVEEQRIVLWED